jgi:hypothetical protein
MLCQAYRRANLTADTRAFTLVELLVVVACITMLMGILMPGLRSARQRANETTCAARLQQWGLAFACYANENRGIWPHCDGLDRNPPAIDAPDITREEVADWHGWVDLLPPLIGLKPRRDYPRNGHPDETTLYQCPSGRPIADTGEYSYRPRRDGYFSYAMNSCLELDRNAWPPPEHVGYPMPSFLDTAKIVWPSQVILLFDQLLDPYKGFGGSQVYRSAGQHCGSYPIAFAARHRRGANELGGNVLYADDHVEWQQTVWKPEWGEWDIDHQQAPPRDDLNWYPYPVRGGG